MLRDRSSTLSIRTPEGIVFSQPLAGPVTRFLAWIIDLLLILAVATALNKLFGAIGVVNPDVARAASTLSFFVMSIGYGILLEWSWRGQTIGKRILRLRVTDAEGMRLSFSQVAIRNLLRFVDALPLLYLVGGLACLVSRKSQRLGDVAASTVVLRIPRADEPDLEQILAGRFNSLRQYPHLAARLRQRVSPEEAGIALRALVRREELAPTARLELFERIAAHFRTIVELPPEAMEGITAEQYVRNVVDVLFYARPGGQAHR